MRRLGAVLVAGLLAFPPAMAADGAAPEQRGDVFDILASELLRTLETRKDARERLFDRFGVGEGRRIAVWPFKKGQIPVPVETTEAWNESLTDSLLREGGPGLKLVTRTDLAVLIKEVSSMDVTGEVENPVALVARNATADILVIGRGLTVEDGVQLSYRAVEVKTGAILGTTGRHLVKVDFAAAGKNQPSMTLDTALEDAATQLSNIGPVMKRVRMGGVRYGDSGIQPPFGQFVMRRATDLLQEKMNDPIAGNRLKVVEGVLDEKRLEKARGIDMNAKKVDDLVAGQEEGDYLLAGTYWDFEGQVELRLSLRNAQGEGRAWSRRILKASIPPKLDLVPKKPDFGDSENDGLGPIGLDLTSNKGRNPVYSIGETMVLMVRTTEDAHLYCFYKQVDGNTLKIFPNPYVTAAKIKGRAMQRIPGPGMPFEFTVSEPVGVETVKCFALDQEVIRKLPPEAGRNSLDPLPPVIANRLPGLFRDIPGVKISEATMTVTVQRGH